MGFFDFLKKKKEEETVKFSQVKDWMGRYVKEQNIDDRIKMFQKEIEIKIKNCKEMLEELERAGLMNENIPERVKHIMDGNRKNYIQKITLFLDNLEIPSDYLAIREFSKELTERMDALSKETQKSYFVLNEFVATELSKVAKKVKEIENVAIEFREEIEKSNLHKLEEIKEQLNNHEESKTVLSDLKSEKENKQRELEELKEKAKAIEKKVTELKTGKGYQEYQKLNEEKDKVANDLQRQKTKIISHFSTIEKAFKKYKRQSLSEELIDSYLDDAPNALLKDTDLKILEVTKKMLSNLDKLGLKDKKLEKTEKELKNLTKDLLTKLKSDLEEKKSQMKSNKEALLANTSAMNISEQESWLESTDMRIREKERDIEDTEHKIERVNPKLIKQKVRDILKDFSVVMENG